MNDLISRQDALAWCKKDDWGTPDERWRPESEYGRYIETLPTAEPQWVPCTAKFFLPINGTVIVSDGDKYVTVGYLNIIGEWYDMHGNRLKDVRAWMPLPKPYMGGDRNEEGRD